MKATTLAVLLADGGYGAVAGARVDDIVAQARRVRDSGLFEGKRAVGGVVLDSGRPFPVMQFRVTAAADEAKVASRKRKVG